MLEAITATQATTVILDITGVAVIDAAVAHALSRLATGVQLMGATLLISGIRSEVAQAIVAQQIELAPARTVRSLEGVALVVNHHES